MLALGDREVESWNTDKISKIIIESMEVHMVHIINHCFKYIILYTRITFQQKTMIEGHNLGKDGIMACSLKSYMYSLVWVTL